MFGFGGVREKEKGHCLIMDVLIITALKGCLQYCSTAERQGEWGESISSWLNDYVFIILSMGDTVGDSVFVLIIIIDGLF